MTKIYKIPLGAFQFKASEEVTEFHATEAASTWL
jgi:hypothetical protein